MQKKLGYEKKILLDDYATSTYENAKNIKNIIKSDLKNNISKLYIVTSSYHVPSVTLIFNKAFKNEPYKFKIIGTHSSYSSKNLLKSVVIEVLSIFQDIPSVYLCKVLEREDIYDKTLRKIKNIFVKILN
ncbi:MAG: YdcF family protein [Candidatus Aenigmatarchaeota archaeon]